ncbi:alpha-1,2-fucosyltransferase [Algoriphagus sp. AGSA1]|nr:alpha-1,2-fucosyltransferase [Algoriphagus sp. AGSA1]
MAKKYGFQFEVLARMDSPNDSRRHNHLGLFNIQSPYTGKLNTLLVRMLFIQKFNIGKWLRKRLKSNKLLTLVHDPETGYHPELLQDAIGNVLLLGYWQSFKYFEKIKCELVEEFKLKEVPRDRENQSLNELIPKCESIAIHIRRGDYVSEEYFLKNFGTCSLDYYQNAIALIAERVQSPQFFIFTDDPVWVRDRLKIDYPHTFITHNLGKSDYEDFRLMSVCKHFIVANSSFSWWAAWIGNYLDKIVIAPTPWFVKDSLPQEDRIPNEWIKLPI